jgi:aminoglycoside phosphotransferase (APT) family kinase protein
MSWLWRRHAPEPNKIADPWRGLLKDDSEIMLTHGDLHRSNIIVSAASPARVIAIIDWEQSGWYPDYWEYCKMDYVAAYDDDWRSAGWTDSILVPQPAAKEAFDFYSNAFGY